MFRTVTRPLGRPCLAGALAVAFLVIPGAFAAPASAAATAARAATPTPRLEVPPPRVDPFYRPPSPLPPGAPGTIIRSRRVTVQAIPVVPVPVRAWQVLYLSRSARNEPNAVSGTVLVPASPWSRGPRPLVSYAVGTHGLGSDCAPSYRLRTGTEYETSLIGGALLRGWAVAVTDYEGLGTPGPHTYTAGASQGHAVLDMARAAGRLDEAGLSADGPVGIWGYSAAGQSSAWAAELRRSYAPELNVAGVAAGGVPTDLVGVMNAIEGGPFAGLTLAAAIGLAAAYPDLPFESMLNSRGERAAAFARGSCVEAITSRYAFTKITDFTTVEDPLNEPHWRARIAEQALPQRTPDVPVLIYHGTLDELIPFSQAEGLRRDYCARDVAVSWKPIPANEHVEAAATGSPFAVSWLADRFAGRPAGGDC
ncbi:MAG: hypothetical protein GEV03_10460 [Streptosporangiales bacterium]|nr:hypothetical protein [Streptosporangiales bacterium]